MLHLLAPGEIRTPNPLVPIQVLEHRSQPAATPQVVVWTRPSQPIGGLSGELRMAGFTATPRRSCVPKLCVAGCGGDPRDFRSPPPRRCRGQVRRERAARLRCAMPNIRNYRRNHGANRAAHRGFELHHQHAPLSRAPTGIRQDRLIAAQSSPYIINGDETSISPKRAKRHGA